MQAELEDINLNGFSLFFCAKSTGSTSVAYTVGRMKTEYNSPEVGFSMSVLLRMNLPVYDHFIEVLCCWTVVPPACHDAYLQAA